MASLNFLMYKREDEVQNPQGCQKNFRRYHQLPEGLSPVWSNLSFFLPPILSVVIEYKTPMKWLQFLRSHRKVETTRHNSDHEVTATAEASSNVLGEQAQEATLIVSCTLPYSTQDIKSMARNGTSIPRPRRKRRAMKILPRDSSHYGAICNLHRSPFCTKNSPCLWVTAVWEVSVFIKLNSLLTSLSLSPPLLPLLNGFH